MGSISANWSRQPRPGAQTTQPVGPPVGFNPWGNTTMPPGYSPWTPNLDPEMPRTVDSLPGLPGAAFQPQPEMSGQPAMAVPPQGPPAPSGMPGLGSRPLVQGMSLYGFGMPGRASASWLQRAGPWNPFQGRLSSFIRG